ncbi:MAG: hypothetical protein KBA31_20545 [Alphaproteobacteria bacterium]|nr:hypothetical protein [Alphaproteobacteria bacterium]
MQFGSGGVCIGPTPWEGSNAYLHEVYEPLTLAEVRGLEVHYRTTLSDGMRGFFLNANGASLFGSILSISGVVGLIDRKVTGGIRQPISLDYGNVVERPRGLERSDFVFGGIIGDSVVGQLVVATNGGVRLVHPTNGKDVGDGWDTFESFIFGEIDRLSALHSTSGQFLGSPSDRLPPKARRWEQPARR